MKTIIIKVGTNVLTKEDKLLCEETMAHITNQIQKAIEDGWRVILVSSGAIAAGKEVVPDLKGHDPVQRRQVYASLGQVNLMSRYHQLFSQYQIAVGQVLATKDDFRTRSHYLNMRNCLEGLVENGIVPIMNENDSVSVTEHMFTDNDELACLVGTMMQADIVLLLTSVDGILDTICEPNKTCIIEELDPDDDGVFSHISQEKSPFGRGGMITKAHFAMKAAKLGSDVYIANGKKKNIITEVTQGNNPGTRIRAAHKVSSIKRWLAFSDTEQNGAIILNDGAVTAFLQRTTPMSLLPIGIHRVEGDFEKGDAIGIFDKERTQLGVGTAQYDAEQARQLMGKPNQKPLIHYDNLWMP
jgi:glutamate 5-kinase